MAELNKDPYVDDSEIASDASNPIEIGGGWDKFYEEHPECKVSAENDLLP